VSPRETTTSGVPPDPETSVVAAAGEGPALEPHHWVGPRAVGETAIVNGVLLVLGLATGVLAARLLGPEGRGALAVGTAVAGLATVAVGFGFPQAFTYLVAGTTETAKMAASLALWSGLVAGGLAVIVGWVMVQVVVQDSTVDKVVRIALVAVPGSVIATNMAGVFQGLRLGRRFNATRLTLPSAYFVGTVGVALIAETATPEEFVGAYAVAATLAAVAAYALLSPTLRHLRLPSRSFVASTVRYGAIAGIGGAALVVNNYLAIPILGAFSGLRETGFYAIGLSYAIPVSVVASAIAIHTFPDVAAAASDARSRLIRRRLVVTSVSLVPLAAGAALAAPLLVPAFFGQEFRPAVSPAQILVGAQCVRGLAYVLADIGRGLGHPGVPSFAEVVGMVTTVGLLPLVVPALGISGAAAVVLVANAIVAFVLLIPIGREVGLVDRES
jgi:O-antigen/teichoic acid export membrane protein